MHRSTTATLHKWPVDKSYKFILCFFLCHRCAFSTSFVCMSLLELSLLASSQFASSFFYNLILPMKTVINFIYTDRHTRSHTLFDFFALKKPPLFTIPNSNASLAHFSFRLLLIFFFFFGFAFFSTLFLFTFISISCWWFSYTQKFFFPGTCLIKNFEN